MGIKVVLAHGKTGGLLPILPWLPMPPVRLHRRRPLTFRPVTARSLRILPKCCEPIMMVQHPLHLRNRIALMPDAVEKITYNDQTNDLIQESLRMQTKFGISIPWENCQNYPKWIKFTSSIRKRKNRNEYPFQRRRPFNQHGSSHLGGYPSCGVEATMAFLMLRRQLP